MYRVIVQEDPVQDSQASYTCSEEPTFEAVAVEATNGNTIYYRFCNFTARNGYHPGPRRVPMDRIVAIVEEA
jgi:hypothetical protein